MTTPDIRATLLEQLLDGVDNWISPDHADQWIQAIVHEWPRVELWRGRVCPLTRRRYTWLQAIRLVSENSPVFDEFWGQVFTVEAAINGPNVIATARPCQLCGAVTETRPYGPAGEQTCQDCGVFDETAAARRAARTELSPN
jgi:hypothetical protein